MPERESQALQTMGDNNLAAEIYSLQLESALETAQEILTRLQSNDSNYAAMLADDFKQALCQMREDERADAVKNVTLWIQTHADGRAGQMFDVLGIVRDPTPAISDGIKESLIRECLQEAAKTDDVARREELILSAARMLADAHPLVKDRWRKEFARIVGVTSKTFDSLLCQIDSKKAAPTSRPDAVRDVYALTDLGNAERLAAWHSDSLRFVSAWGWLAWDGRRWERNEGAAQRLAKQTARNIYTEASSGATEDERAAIAAWAIKSEGEGRLRSMLALAESEAGIDSRPESFDADPMLLNCVNGTLDLRTGALRPHSPTDRLTRIAGTEYNSGAVCPTWLSFLDRIMGGNAALIDFLRRAAGYSLGGLTAEGCMFFCYGTGANGKTTFLEAVRGALGDYAQQADFETFLSKRGDGGIRNDVARMNGMRFIAAIEAGEGRRLNEPVIKTLTGGDTVTARYLYREHFEFRPQFKLWLAANHKPVIRGTDNAIWRRIRLVPFTVTIPEGERDPKLLAKLRTELPGILAWAVRGCLEWQSDGLRPPAEVLAATNDYRAEMDTLAAFLDECCVVAPGAEAKAADLYAAIVAWAEAGGEHVGTQRAFGLRLAERGFEKVKRGVIHWRGIGLLARDDRDDVD